MKIAILGTGNMAQGLAARFKAVGHDVALASREASKGIQAIKAVENAAFVVLAVPFAAAEETLKSAGDLTGRIVIDITNPLTADYMGLTVGHSTSAGEEIQKLVPGAKVVKAFNTVFAQILAQGPILAGEKVPVYVASDDEAARKAVSDLVATTGFAAIDSGTLKNARYLEPLAGLGIFFAYGQGQGTALTPRWLRAV